MCVRSLRELLCKRAGDRWGCYGSPEWSVESFFIVLVANQFLVLRYVCPTCDSSKLVYCPLAG